jgi:hypothetical protein
VAHGKIPFSPPIEKLTHIVRLMKDLFFREPFVADGKIPFAVSLFLADGKMIFAIN